MLTLQINHVSRSKIVTTVDTYSSACRPPALCQSEFTRDHQGTEQKETCVLQTKCSGGTESRTSCPPLHSGTPHFLLMHLISTCSRRPYSSFWLLPRCAGALPSFQHPPANTKFQPPLRFLPGTAILLQQVTQTLPVWCSLARIKLCHSLSKFTMLSVTIKKPFTLPDKGENCSRQTGEVGGKRNALVVKGSYNWVEIVLSTGARHITLLPYSQELIPHLFSPKINFPAPHPQFIFLVAVASLYSQFLF